MADEDSEGVALSDVSGESGEDFYDEGGDLELSVSFSDVENELSGGSNSEDSGENVVQPFLFEPELSHSESSSSDEDDQSARLNNTNWCTCLHCTTGSTPKECIFCQEIAQIRGKLEESEANGVECITLHPGFQAVCLNIHVLQTAYFAYTEQYRVTLGINEYSHTAYRQLTRWCWEWLGRKVRVTLPSCAVRRIRDAFPSQTGVYVGYQDAMSD